MPTLLRAHHLLVAIDLIVRRDQGPAGFSGTIALGIAGAGEERWWIGSFARERSTTLASDLREHVDAALVLGERDALALFSGHSANELVGFIGDRALFARFLGRYFGRCTSLDLRVRQGRTS